VSRDSRRQDGYGVRFAWGAAGAALAGARGGVLVVIDVLSFTTAVSVAAERGIAVYPAAPGESAVRLARDVGAELAVGRSEVTDAHPWSLSPAALRAARAPARLVLASPNGGAIAAAAEGVVVAGCLRNASAVAAWACRRSGSPDDPVTVIAAGERRPDGSLRPALEDLLGAGAVLAALAQHGAFAESPEAARARAAYEHEPPEALPDAVRRCASGVELAEEGFGEDVEVAVELGAGTVVPVLSEGAFRPA
jgi:2-phosphosulfolactate phosphatase